MGIAVLALVIPRIHEMQYLATEIPLPARVPPGENDLGKALGVGALGLCGLTGYTLVLIRYRTRDWRPPTVAAAIGALITALFVQCEPTHFVWPLDAPVPRMAALEKTFAKATLHAELNSLQRETFDFKGRHWRYLFLDDLRAEGLPAHFFLRPTKWSTVAHSPGGDILPTDERILRPEPHVRPRPGIRSVCAVLGIELDLGPLDHWKHPRTEWGL
ncbi:MAG: hypothetical protein M3463_04775 [Verrucomicrobiota bacterium]|nr:hypothetical protein [Verrucomicrobiota bacterium]